MPTKQRPPKPPPHPHYPTKHARARRLLPQFKAQHPDLRVHCITAEALYGTAPFVDGASALFGGVPVIAQIRSPQNVRVHQREQHVADYFATPPGPPHTIRLRGGDEGVAIVGSARLSVCSHKTKRFIVALKDDSEETSRYLMASNLTWRPLDLVPGHTLSWLVDVFVQDWKSPAGWSQWTKQPGAEGARRRVILSLRVDPCLFLHPDHLVQLSNNLPAYPVGSLRANVHVECVVNVIENLVSSDAPQEPLHRFTHALHQVFAFGRSTTPMIQRQVGRLEPPPSLKDRADEVMRNMPALST